MIRFHIEGAAPLAAALDRYGARTAARARGALAVCADHIAEAARDRIMANRAPDRPSPSFLAASLFVRREGNVIYVGADAPYARIVEYGASDRPAEPFLAPAVLAAPDFFRIAFGEVRP